MKRWTLVLIVAALAIGLGACGSDKKPAALTPGGSTAGTPAGSVQVVTLALLRSVVTGLGTAYTAQNPGVKVNVAVSTPPLIVKAAAAGSPAVLIGDTPTITSAAKSKKLRVVPFGHDVAVIAVATANPKHVTDVNAFAPSSGLRTLICGTTTTRVGNFSFLLLQRDGITPSKDTVRGAGCEALAFKDLASGKLDAALMFRAGLVVPAGVTLLAIPEKQNISFPFSYVVIGSSASTKAFATFVASRSAKLLLVYAGYLP